MQELRIGYTLWPADFDLSEPGPFLDEAEAMGVDTVEIPFFATHLIANGAILEPALKRFRDSLDGRDLIYSAHANLSINLMDRPEKTALHETVARACIELAARLDAGILVLHCGWVPEDAGAEIEDAYARQRDSLAGLADFAASMGVVICLENIWGNGRKTALPGRLAREIRAVGHDHLAATLDYAHSSLQCADDGADLMAEVSALAPLARHLHLNDCFGVDRGLGTNLRSEMLAFGSGDLHLPLGWGGLPWERLLTEPAYPDDLTLNQELHPTFWSALPDDVAELRRLAELMRRRNPEG